jgi:hypothetical protein
MYSTVIMQKKMNEKSKNKYIVGVIAIIITLTVNIGSNKYGNIGKLLHNLAVPRSGEDEILPKEVLFILKYSRVNHVNSISMSPAIAQNRFIAQPLTVSVYPIIMKDSADIFVAYSAETMPINCATLDIYKGIRIAKCN